jgi:hypothetical protein
MRPEEKKLGAVQESTQNELTVWASGAGLMLLRGADGKLLAKLPPEQAERLAQLLCYPLARKTPIAGLLVEASGELVQVRDGQGHLVSVMGPRAAREIAAWLVQG